MKPGARVSASNSDNADESDTTVRVQLIEAQLRILELRDFAIGSAAKVGEMQVRLTTKEHELAQALTVNHYKDIHISNHLAHIARLEAALAENDSRFKQLTARSTQLDHVYASMTWRIGRVLMLPVRILRRLLRRT
jgi:predicted RNase H-like nuclease (RuvC/YqgF family)